jgi:uncharacterized protein (TIGR02598 family)
VFTPSFPAPRKSLARQRRSGFSLVEVVLAVGVISFAFVAILGLLPAGLSQFRQAMDNSIASQIAQRIIMDAQQSDFDVLTDTAHRQASSVDPFRAKTYSSSDASKSTPLYIRYFDEQGNEIVPQGLTPTAKEAIAIVYHVNTRITPAPSLPGSLPNSSSDLGTSGAGVSLATILVQVAFNPSGKTLAIDSNLMFNTAVEKGLSVRNYSAQIGRND